MKLLSRESGLIAFAVVVFGFALYATRPIVAGDPFRPNESCQRRLHAIGVALDQYAQDHDDRLPLGNWADAVTKLRVHENNLSCSVLAQQGDHFGFALNSEVAGRSVRELRDDTVLVFETDALGWNVVANLAAESTARHPGYRPVLLARQLATRDD